MAERNSDPSSEKTKFSVTAARAALVGRSLPGSPAPAHPDRLPIPAGLGLCGPVRSRRRRWPWQGSGSPAMFVYLIHPAWRRPLPGSSLPWRRRMFSSPRAPHLPISKTAATVSQSQKPSGADDDDMDPHPTQYHENRLKVLASVKAGGVNPYPHKFEVSISIVDYVKKYAVLADGEHLKDVEVNLAGRIMNKRTSSSKLYFYDLYGGGAKVQVITDARDSELDEAEFSKHHSCVKRGDIVGICGYPGPAIR